MKENKWNNLKYFFLTKVKQLKTWGNKITKTNRDQNNNKIKS